MDQVLSLGTEAVPRLRGKLRSTDQVERIGAIRLLGELKATEAVGDLTGLLKNTNDTRIIINASHAIGRIQDKSVTPELLKNASASELNPMRRQAAIVALGLMGDDSAIPVLTQVLSEKDHMVRVFAAGSLGLLGSDRGLEVALASTRSEDASVQMHAIQALGLIGDKKGLPQLEAILKKDPPMVVREAAKLSIFQIQIRALSATAKVQKLKEQVALPGQATRLAEWCLEELARTGSPDAQVALQEICRSPIEPRLVKIALRQQQILDIRVQLKERAGR